MAMADGPHFTTCWRLRYPRRARARSDYPSGRMAFPFRPSRPRIICGFRLRPPGTRKRRILRPAVRVVIDDGFQFRGHRGALDVASPNFTGCNVVPVKVMIGGAVGAQGCAFEREAAEDSTCPRVRENFGME